MYGDTDAARRRVSQLREQALDVRAMADRLVANAEAVPWHGRAAESMRTRIKERASHLRAAAAAHETAAESLARHLAEVDSVKEAIAHRQSRATSLIDEAKAQVAQAANEAATPESAPEPTDDQTKLLAFDPPEDGHKDWLTVTLPGLRDLGM